MVLVWERPIKFVESQPDAAAMVCRTGDPNMILCRCDDGCISWCHYFFLQLSDGTVVMNAHKEHLDLRKAFTPGIEPHARRV